MLQDDDLLPFEAQEILRPASDELLRLATAGNIDLNRVARAALNARGKIFPYDTRTKYEQEISCPTCGRIDDIWYDLKGSAVCGGCGDWYFLSRTQPRAAT